MNEVWLTFDHFVMRGIYIENLFSKSQVFIKRIFKGSLECQGFWFLFSICYIFK